MLLSLNFYLASVHDIREDGNSALLFLWFGQISRFTVLSVYLGTCSLPESFRCLLACVWCPEAYDPGKGRLLKLPFSLFYLHFLPAVPSLFTLPSPGWLGKRSIAWQAESHSHVSWGPWGVLPPSCFNFFLTYLLFCLPLCGVWLKICSTPCFILSSWKRAEWPLQVLSSSVSSFGGDVCKGAPLTFSPAMFSQLLSIFRNISNILRTYLTHLLSVPFLLRDADKVKGLPEPNKHLLFVGLAISFQSLCHVFLFLSSSVGIGRVSHCLLSSLGGPNSFAILSFFFLLFNKVDQYTCI